MTPPLQIDPDLLFAQHPHALQILNSLTNQGHEALVVGGGVRDALWAELNDSHPVFDVPRELDLATSASSEEVRAMFAHWPAKEVGKAFGVLMLFAPDGATYEIATFRTEAEYDGRKPKRVSPARTFAEDVKRRDFTVNGLGVDARGQVIDYVGGLEDLKNNVLRAIGNPTDRFAEDHLRMLRAVRLACKLQFELTPDVESAVRLSAAHIKKLAAERVRDEVWKLLSTPRARHGIGLLHGLGLLQHMLPEISALEGVQQPVKYHPEGDVLTHTLLALNWADQLNLPELSKFAVLVHDVGKPDALKQNGGVHMGGHDGIGAKLAKQIGQRMRLSREQQEVLVWTTQEHMRIAKLPRMGRMKQLRLLQSGLNPPAHPPLKLTTLLHVLLCDAQASAHGPNAWLPVLNLLPELFAQLHDIQRKQGAQKLLDGQDLLNMGLMPGPNVGKILEVVYNQILSGQIQNRSQALRAASKHVANLGKRSHKA